MRCYAKNEPCRPCVDRGPEPFVTDLCGDTVRNPNFRTALWTGEDMQLTLMNIPVGGEIGLEIHHDVEQMLYIVSGRGHVVMGPAPDCFCISTDVCEGSGIFIPKHTWHNVVNTGRTPLKLFSVYAPPQHPRCTVHRTKADSDAAEH